MSRPQEHPGAVWAPLADFKAVFSSNCNAIDGLRGASILMVVLFHCFFILKVVLPQAAFADFIAQTPAWLQVAFNFDKAVDVFFVVSGYLIGGALLQEREDSGTIAIKRFYRRRFFRIVPLFWLAMLLYGSFAWKGDWQSLVANLLFIENLFPALSKIVPVGWSLAIEVQFYLLAPLLFLVPVAQLPRLLLLMLGTLLAIRLGLLLQNPGFYEHLPLDYLIGKVPGSLLLDTLYYPTWSRLSPIVLGLMIPFLVRAYAPFVQQHQRLLVAAALACLFTGFLFPSYQSAPVHAPLLQLAGLTVDRTLVGIGVAVLIICWALSDESAKAERLGSGRRGGSRGGLLKAIFENRLLGVWGRLVYPTYLFHLPMVAVAFLLVFQTSKPSAIVEARVLDVFLAFPLSLLLILPLSLILHVLVEKPFIRLGARYGDPIRR